MKRANLGSLSYALLTCCVAVLSVALVAGCGGGGGGEEPTIQKPPVPPWRLSLYESGKSSPIAEGTLKVERAGYVIQLSDKASDKVTISKRNVRRKGKLVSVPVTQSKNEVFLGREFRHMLDDISSGAATELRSADRKYTYVLRPDNSSAKATSDSASASTASDQQE